MWGSGTARKTALGTAGTLVLVGVAVGFVPSATAAIPPAPNPEIEDSCGVDITLVLDASGSVSSSGAVEDVRDAAEAMLEPLTNTDSLARVTQFATVSEQLAPSTLVTDTALGSGGALRNAINRYYNPKPPRPTGTPPGTEPENVNIWSYDGSGNPQSANNFSLANSSNQYTNWDQALDDANNTTPELVVFVTDGDPTAYDFNKSGDPKDHGPPPDVAVNTDRDQAKAVTIDRAVEEANLVKDNSRMLAIGVGSALDNTESQTRLRQISGPKVVRDSDIDNVDSLNDIDVALVRDFEDLAQLMRSIILQLCSPSLTVTKLAQSSTDAEYLRAPDWPVTVTPTVPGGDFEWILPNTAPAPSKTVLTNQNGAAQFQWEPDPPESDSMATVAEELQDDFVAGRPGPNNDWRCDLRDEEGNVRSESGEFTDPAAPSFVLDPIGQEIVTCAMYNSFDYQPDIALTKVNDPTSVRGDLDPPAEITSTFTATNPGNTSLDNVTVVDDRCGPVAEVPAGGPNVGDVAPRNGLLDPGEAWQFTCDQVVATPDSTDPEGQTVLNNATVVGTDPGGTVVSAGADASVVAFNPAIDLTKLVNGVPAITIPADTEVTYTYRAANTGNTPLGDVDLVDDKAPCTDPTRGPDDPGNDDDVLDVAEAWTFTCTTTPTASVLNLATVTATPLNPEAANAPFPDPNPPVTDRDVAAVALVNPEIELTKAVAPDVVLLGPGDPTPAEPVTYTFTATNNGDTPLNRPGASGGGPSATDPGWVTDPQCMTDAVFVPGPPGGPGGDVDGDELLDPGESWQFTCPGEVTEFTENRADIEAQPSTAAGAPLPVDPVSDFAIAFVDVVRPAIDLIKTALVPVVLDPDAPAVSGPDVPTRRPAEYLYQVTNTGNVPLQIPDPPDDDTCTDFALTRGDTANFGFLDPEEVWEYTCTVTLDRDDANTPPVTGAESGLVTNTATIIGIPFFDNALVPDKAVSDTDTAQVQVIEPGLEITKSVTPSAVLAGRDVTYTITVRNTGDVGLEPVGPEDDKCSPLEYVSGDRAPANGLIDGANSGEPEEWTYTCSRPIGLPEEPNTADVNTVTVAALDPLGNLYTDEDTAEVTAILPQIALTKTVSDNLVPAGTTVTYDFEVTNVGLSPLPADDVLANLALRDFSRPANPSCRTPTLTAKTGGNQDDLLDREPAEVWHYTCAGAVTAPSTNIAVVGAIGGTTIGLRVPVEDFADAFVQPFHPGIEVEKSADPTKLDGPGEVTYTYKVRNTGDVPLAGVAEAITDDTCSPVTYVRGDKDRDGLLDTPDSIFEDSLDEVWVFTCTTRVDETTVNTVVVSGSPTDPEGELLCDEPCDPTDRDRAKVIVGPGGVGPADEGDGAGGLPDTGAPRWLLQMLLLGLLLLAAGTALVVSGVRKPAPTAIAADTLDSLGL